MTTAARSKKVVLTYGMGVDSTAILVRWLLDPTSRDFDLTDLIVLTAQVGDEFADTGRLCDDFIIPLLRAHNIRTVQVARKSASDTDGYVVLEDSRQPSRFITEGSGWSVRSEYLTGGTVPQSGGSHKCSIKFKGWVLDAWLRAEFGETSFRQVIGFELNELSRKAKDAKAEAKRAEKGLGPERTNQFPLIDEWAWDRDACIDYLRAELGAEWPKSCCTFCPFAHNRKNLPAHLSRLAEHPDATADAMVMERVSIALNPRGKLYKTKSIEDIVEDDGRFSEALRIRDEQLEAALWAVYSVRRAFSAGKVDGAVTETKKGPASRDVVVLVAGGLDEVREELTGIADELELAVENESRTERVWVARRADRFPSTEEAFVVAPKLASEKKGPGFDKRWETGLAAEKARDSK